MATVSQATMNEWDPFNHDDSFPAGNESFTEDCERDPRDSCNLFELDPGSPTYIVAGTALWLLVDDLYVKATRVRDNARERAEEEGGKELVAKVNKLKDPAAKRATLGFTGTEPTAPLEMKRKLLRVRLSSLMLLACVSLPARMCRCERCVSV